MLYTLSQANYDQTDLAQLLAQITDNDALVLWQNGVLQALKNPDIFAKIKHCYVLEVDLCARGLHTHLPVISLNELVRLSERFSPQLAW